MKYHFIKMYVGLDWIPKLWFRFSQYVYVENTFQTVSNEIIIGLTANEYNVKSGLWTFFLIFYHHYCYYGGDYDYNFNK